jgi:hypothetical protein
MVHQINDDSRDECNYRNGYARRFGGATRISRLNHDSEDGVISPPPDRCSVPIIRSWPLGHFLRLHAEINEKNRRVRAVASMTTILEITSAGKAHRTMLDSGAAGEA